MCAMTMEQERELTLAEVAQRLHVSTQTVKRRIEARLIRARKEGLEWRIRESDLDDYVRRTYHDGPDTKGK